MDEKVILHALQVYFWDHCLVQCNLKTHQSFLLLFNMGNQRNIPSSGIRWDVRCTEPMEKNLEIERQAAYLVQDFVHPQYHMN